MQQSWFRSIVRKIQWSSLSTPTWPSISTIQKKYGSWNSTPIGVDTARDSRQFGNNWPEILMVTFLFLWPLKKKKVESKGPWNFFLLSNGKADADDFLSLAALSASDLWPNEFISIWPLLTSRVSNDRAFIKMRYSIQMLSIQINIETLLLPYLKELFVSTTLR